MKINLKNFGPIDTAENITVSPMTIFTGDEKSKSYLSVIMYSAIQSSFEITYANLFRNISDTDDYHSLSKSVLQGFMQSFKEQWKNEINSFLKQEGVDILNSENVSITLESYNSNIIIDLNKMDNDKIKPEFLNYMADQIEDSMIFYSMIKSDSKKYIPFPKDVISIFCNTFLKELHGDNFSHPYFMPSVRKEVMRNYIPMTKRAMKLLSGAKGNNTDQYFNTSFYTDLARNLININKKETNNIDILAINKIFESDTLNGKIKIIMPEVGLPIFKYRMDGETNDIEMKDVPESIASLASLSILMRYHLNKNSRLFIEEPEINLDSNKQKSLADVMVKLVNNGVSLVATTKSTVLLKQIENAVKMSQSKKVNEVEKNIDKNLEELNINDVQLYSIEKKAKSGRFIVKNIPFDITNGFSIKNMKIIANDEHVDER